jgi:hypothetical protein
MVALEIPPHLVDFDGDAAQIGDDEIVLRVEVTVESHFVGAGRLRDCFDSYAADAVPMKQIPGRQENSLAWPQNVGTGFGHLVSSRNIDVPSRLTTVLPVGNVTVTEQ